MTDEEKQAIENLNKFIKINQNFICQECGFNQQDEEISIKIALNLIKKQSKEIEELKEELIKERATEIVYVDKNFIRKDRIKPIQIIDLDGKIHNVYKIEEE